ncbi:MAG: hypothetical protein ACHQZS_00435 [Candidatus Binatales bacterium]
MRVSLVVLTLLAVCGIVSCTYNEPRLRTEPIAAAVGTQNFGLQGSEVSLDGLAFRCVEWHSIAGYPSEWLFELFSGWHSKMDECVYLTVDPEGVLPAPSAEKPNPTAKEVANVIAHETDTLLAISNYNCANFLAGAFAAKTNTDFASNVASTILSGSTAVLGLAGGVPALVPAGISAGNSAITGSTASFDSNFFAKQSFDIMETGILADRKVQRAQIEARICETYSELGESPVKDCSIPKTADYEGYTPRRYWTMSEALSDVIEYDRTCSIEGGLRALSGGAAQSQRKADAAAGLGNPTPTPTPAATPTPTASMRPTPTPTSTAATRHRPRR